MSDFVKNFVEERFTKFVFTDACDLHHTRIYQCTACKKDIADNYIEQHKYCLHCGAKVLEVIQ